MSAGQNEASERPEAPPLPPPVPADIGVVAALPIEVGHLLDRLANVRKYTGPRHKVIEGECSGKLIALIIGGPGRNAARRATQLLLDGHRPNVLLSAGFAGALDPDLKRNDIVFASEVIDLEGSRWPIEVPVAADATPSQFRAGRLLTVDQIVRTAAEKAELRVRFEADLVDMESAAVAAVCSERRLRFQSIRVISDEAHTDLPPEILSILGRSGGYRIGAAIGAVWRRPSSFKDLWALREHAEEAADRLAQVVVGILTRLP
ncbi:MAG TPA: nucleoside phosphorylase [Isosphaeraceae bacterium]|jgi:adenosylhomocysteine nucleosidase|nr:nucleoside phosphorylase [Isosphaeraceae bacterium]